MLCLYDLHTRIEKRMKEIRIYLRLLPATSPCSSNHRAGDGGASDGGAGDVIRLSQETQERKSDKVANKHTTIKMGETVVVPEPSAFDKILEEHVQRERG
jgi:hypothetical protein